MSVLCCGCRLACRCQPTPQFFDGDGCKMFIRSEEDNLLIVGGKA
jgi:hypothetical protein